MCTHRKRMIAINTSFFLVRKISFGVLVLHLVAAFWALEKEHFIARFRAAAALAGPGFPGELSFQLSGQLFFPFPL